LVTNVDARAAIEAAGFSAAGRLITVRFPHVSARLVVGRSGARRVSRCRFPTSGTDGEGG
jgi:hypothetical protein